MAIWLATPPTATPDQSTTTPTHDTEHALTITDTPTITDEANGVPTAKLFGTIAKMKENGDLAAFQFSAKNEWIEGTASAPTIHEWYGAGAEHAHVQEFRFAADHPTLGHGHGPTPQGYVLHALAACITAGIATGAAARGIELTKETCTPMPGSVRNFVYRA